MDLTANHLKGFGEELMKLSAELTTESRGQIAKKNFALNQKQSKTGKPAYPIHDERHARAALGFVGMHGSPTEKAEVYKDVAKKYPHLAAKSSIPALRSKEKDSNMMGGGAAAPESYGASKLPSSFSAPPVGGSMKMSSAAGMLGKALGPTSRVGQHLSRNAHTYDLAGLGVLAAPSVAELGEQAAHRRAGGAVDKRGVGKSLAEIGGLGLLAAPVAASMLGKH